MEEGISFSLSKIKNVPLRRSLIVVTFPFVLAFNYVMLIAQITWFTVKVVFQAPFNLIDSAKNIW